MTELPRTVLVIDTETTGLLPDARVCEIGWLSLVPGMEPAGREYLVNPGRPIGAQAAAVHGITDAMVADALTWEPFNALITTIRGHDAIMGWNFIGFDATVIREHIGELRGLGMDPPATGRVPIWDAGSLFKAYLMRESGWVQGGPRFDAEPWRRKPHETPEDFMRRVLDARVKGIRWNLAAAVAFFNVDISAFGQAHRVRADVAAVAAIWGKMKDRRDLYLDPLLEVKVAA